MAFLVLETTVPLIFPYNDYLRMNGPLILRSMLFHPHHKIAMLTRATPVVVVAGAEVVVEGKW